MANISKHHPKEEGKGDTSENSRIGFFVKRNTIGINNLLIHPGVVVGFDERGWLNGVFIEELELG